MRVRPLIGILLASTLAGGCWQEASVGGDSDQQLESAPRFHTRDAGDTLGVVLFIHGVTGNATDTWTEEATGTYWPDLIAADPAFDGFATYLFEYRSPRLDQSLRIADIARGFAQFVSEDGLDTVPELVVIAHSMGGLVLRSYLLSTPDVAPNLTTAFFFGTPTAGSQLARSAAAISRNPQLAELAPGVGSHLEEEVVRWLTAGRELNAHCAYERLESPFLGLIVPLTSALILCNRPPMPIEADHSGLVKPAHDRTLQHLFVRDRFQERATSVANRVQTTGAVAVSLQEIQVLGRCDPRESFPPGGDYYYAMAVNDSIVLGLPRESAITNVDADSTIHIDRTRAVLVPDGRGVRVNLTVGNRNTNRPDDEILFEASRANEYRGLDTLSALNSTATCDARVVVRFGLD